jgi:hypothetical protein
MSLQRWILKKYEQKDKHNHILVSKLLKNYNQYDYYHLHYYMFIKFIDISYYLYETIFFFNFWDEIEYKNFDEC